MNIHIHTYVCMHDCIYISGKVTMAQTGMEKSPSKNLMYVCILIRLFACIYQPNHQVTNQTTNPITTTTNNNNIKQAILQTSQRAKNSPFNKIMLRGSPDTFIHFYSDVLQAKYLKFFLSS